MSTSYYIVQLIVFFYFHRRLLETHERDVVPHLRHVLANRSFDPGVQLFVHRRVVHHGANHEASHQLVRGRRGQLRSVHASQN